jgi:diacylglycerol kinase (ATP)
MKKNIERNLEGLFGFWISCGHAFRGILFAFRSQRNFRIHLFAAALVLLAAAGLRLDRVEVILALLTVTLVVVAELLNTAIEYVLNLLEARHHPVVKTAKDVAAGGVLFTVAASVVIGLLLFGPPLLSLLRSYCR